jgi:type I restriction enzyme, S subunit
MSTKWPKVRLGEVLCLCDTSVPTGELTEINLAGIYSFGRGLFKRGPMFPAETSYKSYNRLINDDFVISQPKAWEGALARVTPEFEGWYLSPVFPTFRANRERLDPSFLEWYCKQEIVWKELRYKSRGIGARRESVLPNQFLSIDIPLPLLKEQQRIVAKIEELAGQIDEARTLRQQVDAQIQHMLLGAFLNIADGAPRMPMNEVAPLVRRVVEVDALGTYPEVGVRSFGRGTFHKPSLTGLEVGGKRLFRIQSGDLIFSNVFAWEGAIAVAKPEDEGRFGSHRFITCVPKDELVTSQFLCFYFLTRDGLEQIGEASPGGAGRNRTLGLDALAQIEVPVPDISKQKWFDSLITQTNEIKHLDAKIATEIDALLPSILDKAFKGEL